MRPSAKLDHRTTARRESILQRARQRHRRHIPERSERRPERFIASPAISSLLSVEDAAYMANWSTRRNLRELIVKLVVPVGFRNSNNQIRNFWKCALRPPYWPNEIAFMSPSTKGEDGEYLSRADLAKILQNYAKVARQTGSSSEDSARERLPSHERIPEVGAENTVSGSVDSTAATAEKENITKRLPAADKIPDEIDTLVTQLDPRELTEESSYELSSAENTPTQELVDDRLTGLHLNRDTEVLVVEEDEDILRDSTRKRRKRKLLIDEVKSIKDAEIINNMKNRWRLLAPPVFAATTKKEMSHVQNNVNDVYSLLYRQRSSRETLSPLLEKLFREGKCRKLSSWTRGGS